MISGDEAGFDARGAELETRTSDSFNIELPSGRVPSFDIPPLAGDEVQDEVEKTKFDNSFAKVICHFACMIHKFDKGVP